MDKNIVSLIQKQFEFKPSQVQNTLMLLEDGNTIPFIARYRKEKTGSLDEVAIRDIQKEYQRVEKLLKRKADVEKSITEQGKMTAKIKAQLKDAATLQEVEDIYLPFKKKKVTKAQIARENGLEPLAKYILSFPKKSPKEEAEKYCNEKYPTKNAVMDGAIDILIELFSENVQLRNYIRQQFENYGKLTSKLKKDAIDEQQTYKMYYDFEMKVTNLSSYQILAINRGEKEKILRAKIETNEEIILNYFRFRIISKNVSPANEFIIKAYETAYKKSIKPSIEREIRAKLTESAEKKSISVFGENLYNLLMQTPLKGKVILGVDPAFRTGCKLAVVDETGKFITKDVIYPHETAKDKKPDPKKRAQAVDKIKALLKNYPIQVVAIGNGTASRQTEAFIADILRDYPHVNYVIVNESGASVYSASEIARQEFPDFNVEERSAISIARRIQDPLAELIKIDPKAIGVGQYQHDLPKGQLDDELKEVVQTAVNKVGINLNTASVQLLQNISGLNKTIAQNIINFRNENGKFEKRATLKKVPRLGPKAYEQAAGFLRIIDGKEKLDNTDIHPESYPIAKEILQEIKQSDARLGSDKLKSALQQFSVADFIKKTNYGKQTVEDIVESLDKPGRDVRDKMSGPLLRSDILKLEDLKKRMQLQGTVRNVTDFGAFVDIGVKVDGLVHISQMKKRKIKNPREVVAVGQVIDVWVLEIDQKRNRIQLTMVNPNE